MNFKLLIIDKDYTLVHPLSSQFPQHPKDQIPYKRAKDVIAAYAADGWTIMIASNQGGCIAINPETGKPYKTIREAIAEMRYCLSLFPEIDRAYFCPDGGNTAYCVARPLWLWFRRWSIQGGMKGYRKPQPGMLLKAAEDYKASIYKDAALRAAAFGIDPMSVATSLAHSFRCLYVGDRAEDEQAAESAGIDFVWAEDWRQCDRA